MIDLFARFNPSICDEERRHNCNKYRSETLLETERPGRALDIYPDLNVGVPDHYLRFMVGIPTWHAAEQAVPEVYMNKIRRWAKGEGDSWLTRTRLAQIERNQARLVAA